MPTSLPRRMVRRKPPILFLIWTITLLFAGVAIEFIDPAPMDLAAAWVAAP